MRRVCVLIVLVALALGAAGCLGDEERSGNPRAYETGEGEEAGRERTDPDFAAPTPPNPEAPPPVQGAS